MSDYKLSPNSEIEIGDKVYKLDASFGTIAAIQEALKEDIVKLLQRMDTNLRLDEMATIIAIASKADRNDIGGKLMDIGPTSNAYIMLTFQVMTWLSIALAPKDAREKKSAEGRELLRGLPEVLEKANPSFLGRTTDNLPSASSDIPPQISTPATSGT